MLALVGTSLAGCYDIDATVSFKPDGTASMTTRLDFPRDAEHVANLYKAVMAMQPGFGKYFDEGLCRSVEKMAAENTAQQINLKAREYTTDTRFGCGFLYDAGDSAALIDQLKQAPSQSAGVFRLEELAPRRVRIEIDFSKMPDMTKLMPGLIMLGTMKYGGPNQGIPSMEAIDRVSKAYVDAALAMARMSAPNNHVQFAIRARKVIDTNGEQSGDLVKFRWSWEEFTRLILKPADGKQESKIFYAVIDY
jgi:hypothetical protein